MEKYCCFPFRREAEFCPRISNQKCFVCYSLTVYTSTHLNTPQHTIAPIDLRCTGTPVGEGGTQTEIRARWGALNTRVHQKLGLGEERGDARVGGVEGGMGQEEKGGSAYMRSE